MIVALKPKQSKAKIKIDFILSPDDIVFEMHHCDVLPRPLTMYVLTFSSVGSQDNLRTAS